MDSNQSPHLGEVVRESMDEVGWTVAETADRLGCERGTLSLEAIGWGTAEHWMRMQASYALAQLRRERGDAQRRTELSFA